MEADERKARLPGGSIYIRRQKEMEAERKGYNIKEMEAERKARFRLQSGPNKNKSSGAKMMKASRKAGSTATYTIKWLQDKGYSGVQVQCRKCREGFNMPEDNTLIILLFAIIVAYMFYNKK